MQHQGPRKWPTRVVVLVIVVGVPLAIFSGPLRKMWMGRAFAVEQIRDFQELCGGEAQGVIPSTPLPARTGKVLIIRPGTYSVQLGGSLPSNVRYSGILRSYRNRIIREIDPPRLADSWFDLPTTIRASTPEEVGTVIFLETAAVKDGIYVPVDFNLRDMSSPRIDAIRRDTILKVYDWKSRRFLGAYVARGETPPNETTVLGDHHGEAQDVSQVVSRMPVR